MAAFFIFIASSGATAFYFLAHSHRMAALEVCQLIDQNYIFASSTDVRSFLIDCVDEAEKESLVLSRASEVQRINRRLSRIKTSHLSLFTPDENHQLWQNEGRDTGIRARTIESDVVIYEVLPKSPAAKLDLQVGDSLLTINGQDINADDASTLSGHLKFARGAKMMDLEIRPEVLAQDLGPRLKSLDSKTAILRLQSFLPNYFEEQSWKNLTAQFNSYANLIIDVRGNSGGSFPAMLRALSPFRCTDPRVGSIQTGDVVSDESIADEILRDDLSTENQIGQLSHGRVALRVFEGYGCFHGNVIVLVDSDTASTAEIFAQSFEHRKQSRVFGQPSAGRVVMARWFPVSAFGNDEYQISIPIARYTSVEGRDLESVGLTPEKELHYDLEQALQGRDSWIASAHKSFSRFVSK